MSELLHDPAAALVARHDADLQSVQRQLFEPELHDHGDGFGDVRIAGLALIDPVPDGARLHRAADHVVEVDLTDHLLVDEQPELVGGPGGAVAVALLTARREGAAVGDGIGLVQRPTRLPDGQPLGVAEAHLAPRAEVVGRQRSQHHPPAVQPHRRVRPGGVAQHHQRAADVGSMPTAARSRRRMIPSITQHVAMIDSTCASGRPGLWRRSVAASTARVRNTSSASARRSS